MVYVSDFSDFVAILYIAAEHFAGNNHRGIGKCQIADADCQIKRHLNFIIELIHHTFCCIIIQITFNVWVH